MAAREKLDDKALNDALLDAAVVAWEKIEEDGKPLECNMANKKRLDDNWQEFSVLWQRVLSGSSDAAALREQELIKN
jgi:hypothetical protein